MDRKSLIVAAAATLFAGASALLAAEDWPKWRGPAGDNITRTENFNPKWDGGPKEAWRTAVGVGYASPVIVGNRVYAFAVDSDGLETLYSIDVATGKPVWKQGYKPGVSQRGYRGTRATPVVDGKTIITYGLAGDLVARNLDTGDQLWQINVLKETGGSTLQWQQASSPFVTGDAVVVQGGVGGPLCIAVNKNTGKVIWKSEAGGAGGYAHPIQITAGGKPLLLVFAGSGLVAIDPANGKTLWTHAHQTAYNVNASTPIHRDGKVFLTSAYGTGSVLLQVTATGAKEIWANKNAQSRFQGAILDGDHLYLNSEGVLMCVEWATGKVAWQSKDKTLGQGGSLIRVGKSLLLGQSERGRLMVFEATPEGHKLVAEKQVFEKGENWATPALVNGRIYAKGMEDLVAFEVAK